MTDPEDYDEEDPYDLADEADYTPPLPVGPGMTLPVGPGMTLAEYEADEIDPAYLKWKAAQPKARRNPKRATNKWRSNPFIIEY